MIMNAYHTSSSWIDSGVESSQSNQPTEFFGGGGRFLLQGLKKKKMVLSDHETRTGTEYSAVSRSIGGSRNRL